MKKETKTKILKILQKEGKEKAIQEIANKETLLIQDFLKINYNPTNKQRYYAAAKIVEQLMKEQQPVINAAIQQKLKIVKESEINLTDGQQITIYAAGLKLILAMIDGKLHSNFSIIEVPEHKEPDQQPNKTENLSDVNENEENLPF